MLKHKTWNHGSVIRINMNLGSQCFGTITKLALFFFFFFFFFHTMALMSNNLIMRIFTGHPKTLDQFTYQDSDINDVIVSCISNISIIGIGGSIALGEGADPIKNVKIERIQGKKTKHHENTPI